jgi:ribonucleotide reductase beta subunit family protein with ferritin-like domain
MTKGNLKNFVLWNKETKNIDIEELWKEYNIRPTITIDELLQYVAHLFNLSITQLKYSSLQKENAPWARGMIMQLLQVENDWTSRQTALLFGIEQSTARFWKYKKFTLDLATKDKYFLIKKFVNNKEVL